MLEPAELELVSSTAQSLGVPIQNLNPLKRWLIAVQLGVIAANRQGLDVANTPSATIAALAQDKNKSLSALEGPTELMLKIADLDEEEQIGMLTHNAKSLRDNPDRTKQLYTAWPVGDVAQVGDILHGPDGAWSSDVVYRTMLVERNKDWSDTVGELMAEHKGTVFMAVGLGHLAGRDSLVAMLEANGFEVKRF